MVSSRHSIGVVFHELTFRVQFGTFITQSSDVRYAGMINMCVGVTLTSYATTHDICDDAIWNIGTANTRM